MTKRSNDCLPSAVQRPLPLGLPEQLATRPDDVSLHNSLRSDATVEAANKNAQQPTFQRLLNHFRQLEQHGAGNQRGTQNNSGSNVSGHSFIRELRPGASGFWSMTSRAAVSIELPWTLTASAQNCAEDFS